MAGGNPASSNAVTKTKRTASIGTTAGNLDSKPKTTSGMLTFPPWIIVLSCHILIMNVAATFCSLTRYDVKTFDVFNFQGTKFIARPPANIEGLEQ